MARICIVTSSALGSNPRVVKEAQALCERGHVVKVISTRTLELVDRRDDDVLASASWISDRIDLRSTARWKLRRLAQLPARLLSKLPQMAFDTAQSAVTAELTRHATSWRADLYIAHYVAALPAAARAARRHGARYAFDAEDFHLGDLPEAATYAFEKKLIRAVEARYLPGCAYITAASPGIADAYAQTYGIERPQVILNVFPKSQAPEQFNAKGSMKPGPSLYWFSQSIGPDRGLECAVEAISVASSRPHLYLRGTLAAGFFDRLGAIARTFGVEDRVHYLAPAPPSELERAAAIFDVGLVAETGVTQNRRIALCNKQFSYFLGGVPAIMSDTPGHRTFAATAEGAVSLFEPENAIALARAIDHLLGNDTLLAKARATAFGLAQSRFNWETEQVEWVAAVEAALPCTPMASPPLS